MWMWPLTYCLTIDISGVCLRYVGGVQADLLVSSFNVSPPHTYI